MSMSGIDVAIPVHDSGPELNAVLDSLFAQRLPDGIRMEITVCDDGSGRPAASVIEPDKLSRIRLLRHDDNRGRAAACNTAARAGKAGAILVLDADCRLESADSVQEYLRILAKEVDACIGSVRGSSDGFWRRYQDDVAEQRLRAVDQGQYEVLATPNMAIRREAFEQMGGFSEQYQHYGFEDRDLLCRLLEQGRRIVYRPDLAVLNEDQPSVVSLARKMEAAARDSARVFHLRHPVAYRRSVYFRLDARLHGRALGFLAALTAPFVGLMARSVERLVDVPVLPYRLKKSLVKVVNGLAFLKGSLRRVPDEGTVTEAGRIPPE